MSFDLSNLAGVAGEILRDTRTVTDPWGFGIEAVVVRADCHDWKKFELSVVGDTPMAERWRLITAEEFADNLVPDAGQRQAKKATKAEKKQRVVRKLAVKEEVETDIEALRNRKSGIASILVRNMWGFVENGKVVDLSTPEAREAVFAHERYHFTDEEGNAVTRMSPLYERDEDGEILLDDAGEPVENQYGGKNMGDALAQWLWDEAKNLAAFSLKERAKALGTSSDTLTGSIASGSHDQSPNDE